jgi:hypothetical protein
MRLNGSHFSKNRSNISLSGFRLPRRPYWTKISGFVSHLLPSPEEESEDREFGRGWPERVQNIQVRNHQERSIR